MSKKNMSKTELNFIPNYIFDFEDDVKYNHVSNWVQSNPVYCIYFMFLYVILTFAAKSYMKSRQPYDLRKPMALWSLVLAIFSIVALIRLAPELIYVWKNFGFHQTVCDKNPLYTNQVTRFWTLIFVLSKIAEFGDTAFIVLRKQKLIFLHWYHHMTALLYVWITARYEIALTRWCLVTNLSVHSVMYTYFALKAMKFRVPRFVAVGITTAQILQMIIVLFVNSWAFVTILKGEECYSFKEHISMLYVIYGSYFVLFAIFFRNSYMHKKSVKSENVKIE